MTFERSDPGLRCSRLIRQLDDIQGCRVLKVRGVRELIREFGPDTNFPFSKALNSIGSAAFSEFEDLYIERRKGGKLQPNHVFQYLVSHGVFRAGLEFKCPNCELKIWIHLDEVKTFSKCVYCGYRFDVTPQLRDRDCWQYRRSGIFGRDDNQLGSIPAALALQQLDTSLHEYLLMYSTALKFKSQTAQIEDCEADFVAVVAGRQNIDQTPVQILLGEAKTSGEIDADDARKLSKLADAVPSEIGRTFIMFAKTGTFTPTEVNLARSLNLPEKQRVILWEQDHLEPYSVYERSKDRLGGRPYAISLSDIG